VPAVTFVMPLYNCAELLPAALSSIASQTFKDWNCLVVDDGSSDGSLKVAELATAGDKRFQLISIPHAGIVTALNTAVKHVQSPFIARMDADDTCSPRRLEKQLPLLLQNPNVAAVDCQVSLKESSVTGAGMNAFVAWLNGLTTWPMILQGLFEESPLCHPAVLMRTQQLLQVGGYVDDGTPEDYSLWLRLVAHGHALAKLPQKLFHWSDLPNRLTRTDSRYSPQAMARLKASMLPRIHPSVLDGVTIWGTGPVARLLAPHLLDNGIPIHGFVDVAPRRVGNRILDIPILWYQDWQQFPRPMLVALGKRKAKQEVRSFLQSTTLVEGRDVHFVS